VFENFVEKKFYIHLPLMNKMFAKILICCLFGTLISEAKQGPPAPYAAPPPHQTPIDQNIFFLLLIILSYGIYKHNLNKKTSI
jgi:hypothetical protein